MADNRLDLVNYRASNKGKTGYLFVNTDPENTSDDDIANYVDSVVSYKDEYMADALWFGDYQERECERRITDTIMREEVAPSNIDCYKGILYTATEFPKYNPGITNPDIIAVISLGRAYASVSFGIPNDYVSTPVLLEFDTYDSSKITDYIEDIIRNEHDEYATVLNADDFFIFIGNSKQIKCNFGE